LLCLLCQISIARSLRVFRSLCQAITEPLFIRGLDVIDNGGFDNGAYNAPSLLFLVATGSIELTRH
jgi:hypothetical protein